MNELSQEILQSNYASLKEELIRKVLETAKVKIIFIIAASFSRCLTKNPFVEPQPASQCLSSLLMLVLVDDEQHKPIHDTETHIELLCKDMLPVTVIVVKTGQFHEWLRDGHVFAWTVYHKAAMIYDNSQNILPAPKEPKEDKKEREIILEETMNKAQEFLAGADFFRLRKQNKMAAFMLHQSAEQCLRTLLKLITGFHCNTHSIDRLVRCTGILYPCIHDIFPQQTGKEKERFRLLQKAYIDTRYKDDYTIHQSDLVYLTERVNKLKELLLNNRKDLLQCAANIHHS